MWLVEQNIAVPRQWMHDYNIKNKDGKTLKDLMIENKMPIPNEWQDINKMSIFDQTYFGIIPDIYGHYSNEQNEQGFTIAMILAYNTYIPQCWQHNPEIRNNYGQTIFDICIKHYNIPQQWFCKEVDWQDEDGNTQAMILAKNNIKIPEYLYHNPAIQNNHGDTVAIIMAYNKLLPTRIWKHKSSLQNNDGNTVAMILAANNIEVPNQWNHNPNLTNDDNMTVALYMMQNNVIVPKQWQHKINFNSIHFPQLIEILQYYQNLHNLEWCFSDPEQQDDQGNTMAMILLQNDLQIPQCLYHNPNIKNKRGKTIFEMFIDKNIYPQKWTYLNAEYRYSQNNTQAMLLAQKQMKIPEELFHNPDLQNNSGQTVAMLQAKQGKIPDKQWQHNKFLRCKFITFHSHIRLNYYTVQNFLQYNYKQVPKEWKYDRLNKQEDNKAIIDLKNGLMPTLTDDDIEYQNINGDTAATIAIKLGKIPPKCWIHDPAKQYTATNQTLAMMLVEQNLPIPSYCQHDPNITNYLNNTIFELCIEKNQQPPQWCCNKPDFQFQNGNTQAMLLAQNNIFIPQYLYHDPCIKNNKYQTVAMIQALQGKIPDKQWIHNKHLRFMHSNFFYTVQNILQLKNIKVPDEWKYDNVVDDQDNTEAMLQAQQEQIPDQSVYHDPLQQNKYGNTVAIILSENGIIPPREWMHDLNIENNEKESIKSNLKDYYLPVPYHWHDDDITIFDRACYGEIPKLENHKPDEQNKDGFTVAMILAMLDKEIPKEWYHDPKIQNNDGLTVAMIQALNEKIPDNQWYYNDKICDNYNDTVGIILAKNNIIPPKEWIHDINFENNSNQSIKSLMYMHDYVYKNGYFVLKYQIQKLNDQCQICFEEGEQQFIKTKCGHKICYDCFQQLINQDSQHLCPVCRQKDWCEVIEGYDEEF